MECTFCKKIFTSKSILSTHQKTAKYCLKIQGVSEVLNEYKCIYCNKEFTTKQHLLNHESICKEKEISNKIKVVKEQLDNCFNKEKEKLIKHFNKEKEKLQFKLEEKDKIIIELKEKVAELNGRIHTLKDDHEVFKEIAKQPKTTNNNNTLNITSSIDFDNIDKIKYVIENDFNINYAINGQKGIANFVKDKLLKDDNGKPLYICTDPSRQIFKYKDSRGEIKKDVEAKKLTEYIVDGGIKKKTVDIASKWYTDNEGGIDMEKFDMMMDPQQSILKLKDDNNTFKKELASLTV